MGAEEADLEVIKTVSGRRKGISWAGQGLLFIIPSLVITVVSYVLFGLATNFSAQQLTAFSTTIMLSIVVSLFVTGGIQFLVYRVIDEGDYLKDASAASRGVRIGVLSAVLLSLSACGIMYIVFIDMLSLGLFYYVHFVVLTVLYAAIWTMVSAFWAAQRYGLPAIIFGLAYLVILSLSYGLHQVDPSYTIAGYTMGTVALFTLCLVASRNAFAGSGDQPAAENRVSIIRLPARNISGMLFNTLYVVAIFLDKLIVWINQGIASGVGIEVVGPYSIGAFLGLLPILGIAAMPYFTGSARSVSEEMFKGTLKQIEAKTRAYRRHYRNGAVSAFLISTSIYGLLVAGGIYFVLDGQTLRIAMTIGLGAIFFVIMAFNSAVLPLFRRTGTSAVSVLVVCGCEAASIVFIPQDVWFAAAGFTTGSLLGCLISFIEVKRSFTQFEYNVFRNLVSAT